MKISDIEPHHIAKAMGVPLRIVRRMCEDPAFRFHPPRQIERKGKLREIWPPKSSFREAARKLLTFLSQRLQLSPRAFGSVRGKSYVGSARRHCGKLFVVTRDVQDCFPSILQDPLRLALRRSGLRSDTSRLLAGLMTVEGRVPQGSPLSNLAANVYFLSTDERIEKETAGWGVGTRVTDDLVLSFNDESRALEAEQLLENEVARAGLQVNPSKRDRIGRQSIADRQVVHGLVVNDRRGVRVDRERLRELQALAEAFVRSARGTTASTLEALASERRSLGGHVACLKSLPGSGSRQLRRLLIHGDRHVERTLSALGMTARTRWWTKNKKVDAAKELAARWRTIADGEAAS